LHLYLFVGTDSSSRATLWDNKMKEFGTEAAGTHICICSRPSSSPAQPKQTVVWWADVLEPELG
jgi:hypothetical protein